MKYEGRFRTLKDEMIQKIKEKLKKEEERKKIRQENLEPIKKHDMSK